MDKEEIIIDEIHEKDVEKICEFIYSIAELEVSQSFDTHDRIRAYILRNPGISTLARKGAKIVGTVLCGHDGRRGSIYHTAVLPELRMKGIAKQMVERSLSQLRREGITTAFLFTNEKNLSAQKFWRRIGWEYHSWVQYHDKYFGEIS